MIAVQPLIIVCYYTRRVLLKSMSAKAIKAQEESSKLAVEATLMILIGTGRVIVDAGSMTSDITKGLDVVDSVFKVLDRYTQIEPKDPDGHQLKNKENYPKGEFRCRECRSKESPLHPPSSKPHKSSSSTRQPTPSSSHRLSTIYNANIIVVVQNGQIMETDSKGDLIQNDDKLYT
ncbi:hypothetical protein AAG906_023287 [Vitis piasezkii]